MIVEGKNAKRDDAITNEPVFECLWPLGPAASGKNEPARRIADLSGKTVGELWDGLFHGDIMLAGIREELSKRFPGVKFVGYDKAVNTADVKESLNKQGLEPQTSMPEEFATRIRTDLAQNAQLIRSAGVKVE